MFTSFNFLNIFQDEGRENFEKIFCYNESEINIRIESLKEELNKRIEYELNKIRIEINSRKQP